MENSLEYHKLYQVFKFLTYRKLKPLYVQSNPISSKSPEPQPQQTSNNKKLSPRLTVSYQHNSRPKQLHWHVFGTFKAFPTVICSTKVAVICFLLISPLLHPKIQQESQKNSEKHQEHPKAQKAQSDKHPNRLNENGK